MCRQVLGSRDKGVCWHDIFSLFDHIFTLGRGVLVLMGFNLFPFLLSMKLYKTQRDSKEWFISSGPRTGLQ